MARRSARSLAQSAAMRRYWRRKKAGMHRAPTATAQRKPRKEVIEALATITRYIKRA